MSSPAAQKNVLSYFMEEVELEVVKVMIRVTDEWRMGNSGSVMKAWRCKSGRQ
jgi:hypothetical protein